MNRYGRWIASIGTIALALALAGSAAARNEDDFEEEARRHARGGRAGVHPHPYPHHRSVWAVHRYGMHAYRPAAPGPRVVVHRHAPFTCRTCAQHFRNRARLRRHLHRHHHVPRWRLPSVIRHHTFGAFFHG